MNRRRRIEPIPDAREVVQSAADVARACLQLLVAMDDGDLEAAVRARIAHAQQALKVVDRGPAYAASTIVSLSRLVGALQCKLYDDDARRALAAHDLAALEALTEFEYGPLDVEPPTEPT